MAMPNYHIGYFLQGGITCASNHWHDVAQIWGIQPTQEALVKEHQPFHLGWCSKAPLLLGSWTRPTALDEGTTKEKTLVLPRRFPRTPAVPREQTAAEKSDTEIPIHHTALPHKCTMATFSNHAHFVVSSRVPSLLCFIKTVWSQEVITLNNGSHSYFEKNYQSFQICEDGVAILEPIAYIAVTLAPDLVR